MSRDRGKERVCNDLSDTQRSARTQLAHLIRPFGPLSVHTGKESSPLSLSSGGFIHVMPDRHNAMHIRYATQRQHIIDSVRIAFASRVSVR